MAESAAREKPWFQHPQALVESTTIGARTRVWAFAHVLAGATIGDDCNICDGVFVENDVVVGNRVTVKCGVQLWDGVRLEDDVFIGPNATFTNDIFPRSRQQPVRFAQTVVCRGASVGANATLLAGITIGAGAMVGAGSVVTRSVPSGAIVVGNPARVIDSVHSKRENPSSESLAPAPMNNTNPSDQGSFPSVLLPTFPDARGTLVAGDFARNLPFIPRTYFTVVDVPAGATRGGHAHRNSHEFVVCLRGEFTIHLDDGTTRHEMRLDSPSRGVHVKPYTWCIVSDFTPGAVLLAFLSAPYDIADYLLDHDQFLQQVQARRT